MKYTPSISRFAALFILMIFAACSSNPLVDEHGDGEEVLTVTLTLSDEHVHTLSDVTFTVTVRDHHGDPLMAFDALQVERRLVGSEDWREIEMHAESTTFVGTYTFLTSGEYELRVSGMQSGHNEMEVLYEEPNPLHVGRAHTEIASYRIEFESYPGHIHEGDSAMLTFWVTTADVPTGGLTAEIHCGGPDGTEEEYVAQEDEIGVYHAEHVFGAAGEAHIAIHFTGSDGAEVEADFHVPVVHAH